MWEIKKSSGITDKESYLKEQSAPISDVCHEFCGKLPVFSLSDVSFSVKERDILKGVTFDIPKSSRTVLLGENGCGKTTLLRLISRLEKAKSGAIVQNIDEKFAQKRQAKQGVVQKGRRGLSKSRLSAFYAYRGKGNKIRGEIRRIR